MLILATTFVFLIGLGLYFWWRGPLAQVPPHLSDGELRRLEVQDRLRQTRYQIVTAIGLGATFIATFAQVSLNTQQWNTDYRLKLDHEQAQVFSDATRDLTGATAANLAGHAAYRLRNLVLQNPEAYYFTVSAALISFVRTSTLKNDLRSSTECSVTHETVGGYADREEPPAGAQAAMSVLGDPKFARLGLVFRRGACHQSGLLSIDADVVRVDHFKLDNFDLGNRDFSCSSMTQTRLRRVNFRGSTLAGADLSGATLADFDISGTPAATGVLGDKPFSTALAYSLPEWQRYRCFISDLREADLRNTSLTNASLGGVDFSGADMTGAKLCGADISRANFAGVRGLTKEMVSSACVGRAAENNATSQPVGLIGHAPKVPLCTTRPDRCP